MVKFLRTKRWPYKRARLYKGMYRVSHPTLKINGLLNKICQNIGNLLNRALQPPPISLLSVVYCSYWEDKCGYEATSVSFYLDSGFARRASRRRDGPRGGGEGQEEGARGRQAQDEGGHREGGPPGRAQGGSQAGQAAGGTGDTNCQQLGKIKHSTSELSHQDILTISQYFTPLWSYVEFLDDTSLNSYRHRFWHGVPTSNMVPIPYQPIDFRAMYRVVHHDVH